MNEESPAGWELYDMQNDPYELKNLYEDQKYRDVIQELREKLLEAKRLYGDTDEKYPELMERLKLTT